MLPRRRARAHPPRAGCWTDGPTVRAAIVVWAATRAPRSRYAPARVKLRTVRAKLGVLLGATALSSLASLGAGAWLLQRQMTDIVAARVPAVVRALETEVDDELRDVALMSQLLRASPELADALRRGDAPAAQLRLAPLRQAFPNADLALYRSDGTLFTRLGLADPWPRLAELTALVGALEPGAAQRTGIALQGCGRPSPTAPPAYFVLAPLPGDGALLVCLPLDAWLVQHAAESIGAEVAVIERGSRRVRAATEAFPRGIRAQAADRARIETDGAGRRWAVARARARRLFGARTLSLVVAVDVTEVRTRVQTDLALAAALVSVVALLSLLAGGRVARTMSAAIARLGGAMKRLEDAQYAHVEGIRTGDELEDLAAGFNHMVDGLRDRDRLRATFGKYMTPAIVEHLLAGKVELGGESLMVTVLFSDIRAFTTLSERMEAHALVALLNEYFTEMVTIIMEEGGVVDKYIGDAIMAVFGAPVPRADDALRAVRAATRMRSALDGLNARLAARGAPTLETGIGVHTGEVVAGNIGSEQRMEYTVIGDAVNLASRLEGVTKELGASLVVSEDTWRLVEADVEGRALAEVTVKGRAQPVRCYAVDGVKASREGAP